MHDYYKTPNNEKPILGEGKITKILAKEKGLRPKLEPNLVDLTETKLEQIVKSFIGTEEIYILSRDNSDASLIELGANAPDSGARE